MLDQVQESGPRPLPLRLNTHSFHSPACRTVTRGGILWVSDYRQPFLANWAPFGDAALARRSLILLAASQMADGFIPACAAAAGGHQHTDAGYVDPKGISYMPNIPFGYNTYKMLLIDYSTDYLNCLLDYVLYTGDLGTLDLLWPTVEHLAAAHEAHDYPAGKAYATEWNGWSSLGTMLMQVIAGRMAASYIRAAQAEGVSATVKHFACNNSDWQRCCGNSVVDERTLLDVHLIHRCRQHNRNTMVVVVAGGGVEMASWLDKTAAVLHAWHPGEIGCQAVAEIPFGKVNPSGRLPSTIQGAWEDSASSSNYMPPGGSHYDLPDCDWPSRAVFDVKYEEGVFGGASPLRPLRRFGVRTDKKSLFGRCGHSPAVTGLKEHFHGENRS